VKLIARHTSKTPGFTAHTYGLMICKSEFSITVVLADRDAK